MTVRRTVALALIAACAAYPTRTFAHRLDEYLQASRISIDPDRITIDIDLTPGANVAAKILGWVDRDGDGLISADEGSRYANSVASALGLSVDGRRAPLTLTASRFPRAGDFRLGVGTIRLRVEATTAVPAAGRHRLTFDNTHQPETSVYLVNATVPGDRRLSIVNQQRDPAQRHVTIEYDMASSAASRALATTSVVVAIVVALVVLRRISQHADGPARTTSSRV
jgi:hypothetical protein